MWNILLQSLKTDLAQNFLKKANQISGTVIIYKHFYYDDILAIVNSFFKQLNLNVRILVKDRILAPSPPEGMCNINLKHTHTNWL